jgi:hypothetical protein
MLKYRFLVNQWGQKMPQALPVGPESLMYQFIKIEQFVTPKCIRPDLKKDGKSKGEDLIIQKQARAY